MTAPRTDRSRARRSDIKVLVGATLAVLFVGFMIAGSILVTTRGDKVTVCQPLRVGAASDIRATLDSGGPYFATGGGKCSFFLAVDAGDIVAYKVNQPSGCTLVLREGGRWVCGGRTLDPADLAQYPVSIQSVDHVDTVVVDLAPPAASTTTTTP